MTTKGRKEANLEILRQLKHYLTMNPDIRFGQALRNTGAVVDFVDNDGDVCWANHFNEEPQDTLARMKKVKTKGF